MSNTLIPVFTGTLSNASVQLCDARNLHTFMQVKRDFSNWIKGRIRKFGFEAGLDFLTISRSPDLASGNRGASVDYHLTLDMAKELSMVENNEMGRQARRYFIECEKAQLQQPPALPIPGQPSADQIESATSLAFIIAGQVAIDVQKAVLAGGDKWKHQRWSLSFITDSKFGSPPVVERLPADLRTLEQLHTAVAQGLLTHQDLLDLALVTTTQLCKSTTTKPKGFGDEVARQINQDLPLADLHTIATQANLELLLRVAGQNHSAGVPAPRPCSALNYSPARPQTEPRQKVLEFIAQAGPAGVSRRKLVHGCRAYLGLSHPQRALLLQELLQSQAIYARPTPTGRSEVLVCATHLVTP